MGVFDGSYTRMGLYFLLKGQCTDCGYTSVSWPTTKITMPGESCMHFLMSMNYDFVFYTKTIYLRVFSGTIVGQKHTVYCD